MTDRIAEIEAWLATRIKRNEVRSWKYVDEETMHVRYLLSEVKRLSEPQWSTGPQSIPSTLKIDDEARYLQRIAKLEAVRVAADKYLASIRALLTHKELDWGRYNALDAALAACEPEKSDD